jgi:hypothetical protein
MTLSCWIGAVLIDFWAIGGAYTPRRSAAALLGWRPDDAGLFWTYDSLTLFIGKFSLKEQFVGSPIAVAFRRG